MTNGECGEPVVNPRGVCALCKHVSILQNSHLMPKALYRLLRSPELANPNPTMMTSDFFLETSRQAKTFLLCSACEQRFHRNGEDWMMRNCCRAQDQFRLRESLLAIAPGYFDGQVAVYSGKIAKVDLAKLVYFAVSVLWRAAVKLLDCGVNPFRTVGTWQQVHRAIQAVPSGRIGVSTGCGHYDGGPCVS